MLCAAASLGCIYHCRDFYPSNKVYWNIMRREKKNCVWWLKNTRPGDGSSLPAHNVHPLMRSSVQIHIYAVVVITTYSMFRFSFLYDSNIEYKRKIYVIIIWDLSSRVKIPGNFYVRGRGRASQNKRFLLEKHLTMGISKTIFSLWKSCRQTTGYCFGLNRALRSCLSTFAVVSLRSIDGEVRSSCIMELSETN